MHINSEAHGDHQSPKMGGKGSGESGVHEWCITGKNDTEQK